MKCKDCSACHKGFFESEPDKYVCTGVKEPFVIDNIHHYCTEYLEKNNVDENRIGGAELTFSIQFKSGDKRKYIDKVSELLDMVADDIESIGHSYISGTGKPILKSDLE